MELDLDHIERIARQRQEAGARVAVRPEVILAMAARIRELESASQPGGGEAVRAAFERVMFYEEGAIPGCIALERVGEDYRDLDTHEAWEVWQEACKWQRAAPSAGNGEAEGDGNV